MFFYSLFGIVGNPNVIVSGSCFCNINIPIHIGDALRQAQGTSPRFSVYTERAFDMAQARSKRVEWEMPFDKLRVLRLASQFTLSEPSTWLRPGQSESKCAPGRNRTHNPLFRRQVLYPLSYGRVLISYVTREGK